MQIAPNPAPLAAVLFQAFATSSAAQKMLASLGTC